MRTFSPVVAYTVTLTRKTKRGLVSGVGVCTYVRRTFLREPVVVRILPGIHNVTAHQPRGLRDFAVHDAATCVSSQLVEVNLRRKATQGASGSHLAVDAV